MTSKRNAKIEAEVKKSLRIAHGVYSEMYKTGVKVTKRGTSEIGTVDSISLHNCGTMVGVQFNGRYAIHHAHEIQVAA